MEIGPVSYLSPANRLFHILCATDDAFAQPCGVMMASMFSNRKDEHYIVHILEHGLSETNRQKLKDIGDKFGQNIIFHYVDNQIAAELKVQSDCGVSDAAYYRLYVSSLLTDASIERILYIDCDVVINCNISPLFDIDMENCPIAAVRDINNPVKESQQFSISFSYRDRYFNSGVLLINLKKWREENIQELLVCKAKQINSIIYPDQDPLNAVFKDKWLELPPAWNRFNVVKYEDIYFKNKTDELEYIYKPRIIHYASSNARPWMDMRFVPWGKVYEQYLALTPWNNATKVRVEKKRRYVCLLKVKYANMLYRSPLLFRIFITSIWDLFLFVFHIIKHRSLRYYSPYRILQ